jgi:glycosyltransferase involved in cell wall biosynthesis
MSQSARAILINGRFLMQPVTGVQRVARELVAEMDRLAGAGEIGVPLALACEPGADLDGLSLKYIAVERRGGAAGHAWEQFVLPRMVGGRRLLCLGNTAPVAAVLGGGGVSVMVHDVSYLSQPQAYSRRYRIVTVSTTEAERLQRLRPQRRFVAAQNGGWSNDRVERASPAPRERMVLYVGSLSRRKNVERVIEVAETLAREDGIRTVLVGAGSSILAPVRSSVAPDVAHMLEFVGQVPSLDTLADYYRRAGCLLFPSLYEASPLPPIEAMSLGCPVVASAIPSMTERCGRAALYCDPLDSADILSCVRRVCNEPELGAALRSEGFRQAESYSWRAQARTILQAMTAS